MQYPSCLAHARGRDDDARFFEGIQFYRFLDIADVSETIKTERVLLVREKFVPSFFIETFGMESKNIRHIYGEGAVDKDGDFRESPFVKQFVEEIHQFLGSSQRERGDDDLSSPVDCTVDDLS
jgi:hypothetical protein